MNQKAALSFRLRPSFFLLGLLVLAHSLALAALSAVYDALPMGVAVVLLVLICLSALVSIRHHALLRADQSVVHLMRRSDGLILAQMAGGRVRPVNVRTDSTLFPWLIVLVLDLAGLDDDRAWWQPNWPPGRRRSVILLPDSLEPEPWRQLCIWLRWHLAEGAES